MSSFTLPLTPLLLLPFPFRFSIQTEHNTSVLFTVLLHCHCQYNNNHDSHQVHLHCRHQIRHTRELKLKSYTIIFHIISNQISTTETNYRKNKHDKNDQCWLNTSTTLQKCKCWFCFRLVFVLFPLRCWLRKEKFHVTILPSAMVDLIQVSLRFWTLSGTQSTYSTVEHCSARWQLLAGGTSHHWGHMAQTTPTHKGMVSSTSTQTQPDK